MDTQITKRDFTRTKAALAEFDAGYDERMADFRNRHALTMDQIEKRWKLNLVDKDKVRAAFYQDTSDINSLDDCRRLSIDYMRRIALS